MNRQSGRITAGFNIWKKPNVLGYIFIVRKTESWIDKAMNNFSIKTDKVENLINKLQNVCAIDKENIKKQYHSKHVVSIFPLSGH